MYQVIILLLLTFAALLPGRSSAGEAFVDRLWGGLEIGGGSVRRDMGESETDTALYLSFKGGLAVSRHLLLGIELGGYTMEAGNRWDPSKGAGVTKGFLVGQLYSDAARSGWYGKAGAGYLSYWDNSPGGLEDDGWGATVGVGYDFPMKSLGSFGPLVSVDYGEAGDQEHKAVALALSWTLP